MSASLATSGGARRIVEPCVSLASTPRSSRPSQSSRPLSRDGSTSTPAHSPRTLGARLETGLHELVGHGVVAIRVRGLWAGVDVDPSLLSGRELCEGLLERGVLAKDTHGSTIRLAPPLVASEADIDILLEAIGDTLKAATARA